MDRNSAGSSDSWQSIQSYGYCSKVGCHCPGGQSYVDYAQANTILCRCGHYPADHLHEMKFCRIVDSQGRTVFDLLGSEPMKEVR